jgi:hypothetical protein
MLDGPGGEDREFVLNLAALQNLKARRLLRI